MKELVIISGKGGTGKTSLAASFAALAGGAAVVADCDVDAADLHIVLAPRVRSREEFSSGRVARIREADCIGCGACLARCRFDAVERTDGPEGTHIFAIDESACQGCGVCVRFCPVKAIDFPERVSGEWFVSETRFGTLVHARLSPGRENSGKLVTVIRATARRLAEVSGARLVISDGSPGIGCPVIASLTGAELALIVTEPTVSGLHDFRRAAELAARLMVPAAVCVNKWDINPSKADEIECAAGLAGLRVVRRVPYDAGVTRAQVEGRTLVESSDGPASRAVRAVWHELLGLLGLERAACCGRDGPRARPRCEK